MFYVCLECVVRSTEKSLVERSEERFFNIVVTFWALKLITSAEIATICQIILFTNRKARAESPTTDSAASLMLTSMPQRAESQHSEQKRVNLATIIARPLLLPPP